MPHSSATALAAASETPRIALAPRRLELSVPSSAASAASSARWSAASRPMTALRISPFTCPTAWRTPLPPYRSPPSRSSTASCAPVLAPLGTAARPRAPDTSSTSTSTVGLPRESRISRPTTSSMMLTETPGANVANVDARALGVAANARSVPALGVIPRLRTRAPAVRGALVGTPEGRGGAEASPRRSPGRRRVARPVSGR